MKKIVLVSIVSMIYLVGCSSGKATVQQQTNEIEKVEVEASDNVEEPKTDKQQDQLTSIKIVEQNITIPVGDRTADNVGQENGDYFAIGSDIVKCSDYDNVHLVVELTNNRDGLLTTNAMAWSAALDDGYKLELNNVDYSDIQVQSGSSTTIELNILKEKTVKGNKIVLTYTDINYDETYNEFLQKAFSGATQEECRKAYPQYFEESLVNEFEIEL